MDLNHRFTVPADLAETWKAFNKLSTIAPCFPGATVSTISGDDFAGSVKVKVGPIALVYNGTGQFIERDEDQHRTVIEARGKDKRGNGTATAKVTATFKASGDSTNVEVATDLSITGKPAQFGRGVIQDISDKLLDQFVTCVSDKFSNGFGVDVGPDGPVEAATTAEAATPPASPGSSAPTAPVAPVDREAPTESVSPVDLTEPAAAGSQPGSAPPTEGAPRPPAFTSHPPMASEQDELNAFSAVAPVLVKRLGPVLLAGTAVIAAVVIAIRRAGRGR